MTTIQDRFELRQGLVDAYHDQGYVVLRQLLTPALIAHLQRLMDAQLVVPSDGYQRGFERVLYATCSGDAGIYALLGDPRFRAAVGTLTGEDLFFTQGAGFSLRRKTSTGIAWHIESQSFG